MVGQLLSQNWLMKEFGKWIDSAIRMISYIMSKIWMVLFGESQMICQICQTLLLPNIPTVRFNESNGSMHFQVYKFLIASSKYIHKIMYDKHCCTDYRFLICMQLVIVKLLIFLSNNGLCSVEFQIPHFLCTYVTVRISL